MSKLLNHVSRTAVGYGDRNFFIAADEIVNFLKNCEAIGLKNVADITNEITYLNDAIIDSDCHDADQLRRSLKLLRELVFLIKGSIQEV